MIAVCSENRRKPIRTFCGQSAELLTVNVGGAYSCHCALNCYGMLLYAECYYAQDFEVVEIVGGVPSTLVSTEKFQRN
jgi:hypothetical protein